MEFVATEDRGLIANVVPERRRPLPQDALLLSLNEITDVQMIYGFGEHLPVCRRFWQLYKQYKVYYADNETGSLVTEYVKQCRLKRL